MSGALLFLFVSGSAGATALGLWLFFRRSRLRPQLAAACRRGVPPAIRPLQAVPEDRRADPEPTEARAPGPPDDETLACVSAPAATMLAASVAAEVLEDSGPANAEEPARADCPKDPEPVQAAEPSSSDEGSDRCDSEPIAAVGVVPEAVGSLDNLSTANAKEGMRGEDRHAEVLVAAAEPRTRAGAVAADPQPLLLQTAPPGVAASPGTPEHSTSSSAAPAEGELLTSDGHVIEGRTCETANETPTALGAGEIGAVPDPLTADGTAPPPAAPAGELADANGEDRQPPLPEVAAVAALSEAGAKAATPDLATDDGAQSGLTGAPEESDPGAVQAASLRLSKPAQHRDRRGQRRAHQSQPGAGSKAEPAAVAATLRTPAEVRLRLMLHPVRRTVSLSAVLARPAGYPDRITLLLGAGTELGAYSEDRYDDIDLEWTPGLLSGEVRLGCKEGYQWLRSSRRAHIFSELGDEPGLISVGSASLASPSAIVCRQDDADAVRSAASACGSAELVSHDRWTGVPEGWVVLSGYRPAHAASSTLDPSLTALDPGIGAVIRLSGGLQLRAGSFAQGTPPRIEIEPFPVGARVTIGGASAEMGEDGSWRAAGWEAPGDHLVDVVPGPSLTYRIIRDPWPDGGWDRWDAHPERFSQSNEAPWARAQICGASLIGPSGQHVVAAEAMATVIALGLRRGVAVLRPRPDAPVAVGLLQEAPAFLVSSSGPRRTQGHVDWLAPLSPSPPSRAIDLQWLALVRSAASRRLQLSGESAAGQDAWRRARERARRYRKAGA